MPEFPIKKWNVVKNFYNSGKKEQIVKIDASSVSKQKCFQMGLDAEPIRLRLMSIELDNGEVEILITSLTDIEKYPHELFKELYHLRRPVEEDYKALIVRRK